jgi:hypothetical protein
MGDRYSKLGIPQMNLCGRNRRNPIEHDHKVNQFQGSLNSLAPTRESLGFVESFLGRCAHEFILCTRGESLPPQRKTEQAWVYQGKPQVVRWKSELRCSQSASARTPLQ